MQEEGISNCHINVSHWYDIDIDTDVNEVIGKC